MIKLTKNNISRFTKRLQKSLFSNFNIDIKLNISRKIFAEIFGVQSIKELEQFVEDEEKNNEIMSNFIEESKKFTKNSTPSVTDKNPEDNLKLIQRIRKDNLTASDDDIKNCRILYKEKNNTHYLDKFTLYELINEQFIYFCKFNYLEGIRKIMTSNDNILQNFLDIFNYSLREVNETNSRATYGYVAFTNSNLEIQRYLLTGKYYLNDIQYQDDLSLFHKNSFSTTNNIDNFLFSAKFYNLNKFKYFYTKKYNENHDIFPFNVDGEELILDKFRMICHTINKDNPLLFEFIIEVLLNKNNIDIKELLIQGLQWSIQLNNEKIIFSNVLPSILHFKKNNQFLFSKKEVLNIVEQHINNNNIHEHKDNIIKNIETTILDR